jgi:hypothetical protein
VERNLIRDALLTGAPYSRALPFQFVAAAKAAPKLEEVLDEAMLLSVRAMPKLGGRTLLVVDVSGSMASSLGERSTLDRIEAAGALAVLARERCEDVTVYATAGSDMKQVHATAVLPARHGFALVGALNEAKSKLGGGGIFLKQCMDYIQQHEGEPFDRVLVFTDEQDCDHKANPNTAPRLGTRNYIMNVATYKHGIGSEGGWDRISGFSEGVLDWIIGEEWGQELQQEA